MTPAEACSHPDPYPYYAALPPLAWHTSAGAWVAASASAVEAVLASGELRVRPPDEPIPSALIGTPAGDVFSRLIRMNDGEAHRAARPAVCRRLDGFEADRLREGARRWTARLWRDDPPLFSLPVHVLGEALGIAEPDLSDLVAEVGGFVRGVSPGAGEAQAAAGAAAAARLLGRFAATSLFPGLDAEIAAANAIGLLFQSHDATAGLIGNTVVALAGRPEVLARVRADPEATTPLLGEVMRFDPPVQNTRRWAAAEVEIDGHRIGAGDPILVVLAAASRDPAANTDPGRFCLDRPDRKSFGFGGGVHRCPGSAAATAIAAGAVDALLALGADFVAIAEDREYLPSGNCRIPRFRSGGLR
jgi:cytochrome P450